MKKLEINQMENLNGGTCAPKPPACTPLKNPICGGVVIGCISWWLSIIAGFGCKPCYNPCK